MTEARRLLERAREGLRCEYVKLRTSQRCREACRYPCLSCALLADIDAYSAMTKCEGLTAEEQKWADATMDNTKKWLVPSLRAAAGRVAESRAREGELVAALERIKTGRMDIGGKDEAMPRAVMMSEAAAALPCDTCKGTRVAPVADEDLGGGGVTNSSCPDCVVE